jgi:hypothetical protein
MSTSSGLLDIDAIGPSYTIPPDMLYGLYDKNGNDLLINHNNNGITTHLKDDISNSYRLLSETYSEYSFDFGNNNHKWLSPVYSRIYIHNLPNNNVQILIGFIDGLSGNSINSFGLNGGPQRIPKTMAIEYYTGQVNTGTIDEIKWETWANLTNTQTRHNPKWLNITNGSTIADS